MARVSHMSLSVEISLRQVPLQKRRIRQKGSSTCGVKRCVDQMAVVSTRTMPRLERNTSWTRGGSRFYMSTHSKEDFTTVLLHSLQLIKGEPSAPNWRGECPGGRTRRLVLQRRHDGVVNDRRSSVEGGALQL